MQSMGGVLHLVCEVVAPAECVVLVAYNSGNCGMKWLWKLTQAPGLQLVWPMKVNQTRYQGICSLLCCVSNLAELQSLYGC